MCLFNNLNLLYYEKQFFDYSNFIVLFFHGM